MLMIILSSGEAATAGGPLVGCAGVIDNDGNWQSKARVLSGSCWGPGGRIIGNYKWCKVGIYSSEDAYL